MNIALQYLASTSVDTRPGIICRISLPNNTNSLSIAVVTCFSADLATNSKPVDMMNSAFITCSV